MTPPTTNCLLTSDPYVGLEIGWVKFAQLVETLLEFLMNWLPKDHSPDMNVLLGKHLTAAKHSDSP